MRLIDADAFKQYCSEGLEEMKSLFKTDKGAELAVKVTESFLKDIDEQPTVEAQPNSNEFFNFDAPMVKKSDAVSREAVQDLISRWLSDYLLDETREALETINYKIGDMPSVIPQRKVGKWTRDSKMWFTRFSCSNCGKFCDFDYFCCPYCGQKKEGVKDDE